MGERLQAAVTWIGRGAALLPLQPDQKRIIAGFGPYLKRIETEQAARYWFEDRRCNLALCCGGGVVVLDFDQAEQYRTWAASSPVLARSYTERTRRGHHVFFVGDSRTYQGDGYEVKGRGGFVVLAPSQVGGFTYHISIPGAMLQLPSKLSLLSASSPAATVGMQAIPQGEDTLSRVKAAWSVLDLAQTVTRLSGRDGRWWHGACPFSDHGANHDGRLPFWIDVQRGLWGCYACSIHGDVVNLYARLHGLTVNQAIKAMAAKL